MSKWKGLRLKMTGALGRVLIALWVKTCRMTVLGEDGYVQAKKGGKPIILILWHGRLLLIPYFFRRRGIAALVSPSRDGEIIVQIGLGWGFRVFRGSSSHSIIRVWVEMKKELQGGGELILIPDGPRGPARQLKPGALRLAQETGAILVPFSFSASKKRFLKSWDRFLFFYPFSKIFALFGKPISVSRSLEGDEFEKERRRVEGILNELDAQADRHFEMS